MQMLPKQYDLHHLFFRLRRQFVRYILNSATKFFSFMYPRWAETEHSIALWESAKLHITNFKALS